MQMVSSLKFYSIKDVFEFYRINHKLVVLLIGIITAVYMNVLPGEFVLDDVAIIVESNVVTDTTSPLVPGQMGTNVSKVIKEVFGLSPIPFHAFSIILHIVNTLLVFAFGANFFSKKTGVLAAAVFALHPVNTEAVSWISAKVYLIIFMCFLVMALLYTIYITTKEKKYLLIALIAFAGTFYGLWIPQVLVIPLLLVLLDQFLIKTEFNLKIILAVVLGSLAIFAITVAVSPVWYERIFKPEDFDLNRYLFNFVPYSLYSLLKYLVLPLKLTIYHEYEVTTPFVNFFMGAVTVGYMVTLVTLLVKKNRVLSGLLLLLPLSIIYVFSPKTVTWLVAERYYYIASLGFALLVALFFLEIEKRSQLKNLAVILTVFLCALYSLKIISRNNDWMSRKSIWEAAVRVTPTGARIHNTLGAIYAGEGELQKAVMEFRTAVDLDIKFNQRQGGPYNVALDSLYKMGLVFVDYKQLDNAQKSFELAIKLDPSFYPAYFNLGIMAEQTKNKAKALEYYNHALEIKPDFKEAQQAIARL